MRLNKSTTYHPPPTPAVSDFLASTCIPLSDKLHEAVILSHICWGLGAPPPSSRLAPLPPRPSPPPHPKVGRIRRMARCFAPPPP